MTDLDFATVANFMERNVGMTGIRISQSPVRQYTYGALGRPHPGLCRQTFQRRGASLQRRHAL